VTISRGRKGVRIFTSDKIQLRENIVRADDRTFAMDLADREFARRLGVPTVLLYREGEYFCCESRRPFQAVSLCNFPDVGRIETGPHLVQVFDRCVPIHLRGRSEPLIVCEISLVYLPGVSERHLASRRRSPNFSSFALLLDQVGEANLRNRKNIGLEALAN